MLTFYTDSTKEAYEKMKSDEWKIAIQEYISDLNDSVDGNKLNNQNLLSLFELDTYDIYISWEDITYQTSRLARAFRSCILEQYEKLQTKTPLHQTMNNYLLSHSFKDNLKFLRKAQNLTQKDLAKASTVTLKSIINYENECHLPTGKNLCLLARFFKVDPIELLGTDID